MNNEVSGNVVRRTTDGRIAIVVLDNPPVNALGAQLRRELADQIRAATDDPAVEAIVLTGSGRSFSGGGDINEFDGPIAQPDLPTLIGILDSCPKLVVAAIGGICFGGGLELAMAAHYRISHVKSSLALPETRIGLIPGAGGTQRLPRAIGMEKSIDFILGGEACAANLFVGSPLVDILTEGTLLSEAVAYARKLISDNAPLRRLRDPQVESRGLALTLLAAERQRRKHTADRYPAYLAAIDCLEKAVTSSVDEGQLYERQRFLQLKNSPTARALRYAFLAERNAASIPDVRAGIETRPITAVGIVGAGTMGRGICINFLNVGLPVTLLDSKQDALRQGVAAILGFYESAVKKGKLTDAAVEERMNRLRVTGEFADLGKADLVIEAVFEDMDAKEAVFRRLDQVCKAGTILATNTSTLDVDKIADFTSRPQEVIGTHFFSPANVMRLLEVVRGRRTSKEVLATVMKLAKSIGKIGVVSGVCDGFIGNRMLEHYVRMAGLMVERGAEPWQVDQALERWGMSMGPFRMGDLAGNDIGWAIRQRRYVEKPHVRYAKVADRICERGRYGQKSGKGWYAYRDGDRTPLRDPEVDEIIAEYRRENGIKPRGFSDEEIVQRCIYALINEGARILEQGIALRASDIDVVYLAGYGFPRFRGGPMRYADDVGLPKIVRAMEDFERSSGDLFWKPATLITQLVDDGRRFTF